MLPTLIVASLASVAAALPSIAAIKPFKAPGVWDSRGPCPMLNTLANHGYIPHNGRNLSVELLGNAIAGALNTDPKFGTAPAALFVKGWGKDVFSLADLNTHGILEHVASLSREDQTVINKSAKVSPLRVATLLADSDTEFITPKSIAKTRTRVEALSAPTKLNVQETVLAYIEASLLLMFMNDGPLPSAGTNPPGSAYKAPKNRVRAFLTEERFPTELGWKVSERTIPVVDLVFVMKAVFEEKEPTGGPFFESYVIKFLKSLGFS